MNFKNLNYFFQIFFQRKQNKIQIDSEKQLEKLWDEYCERGYDYVFSAKYLKIFSTELESILLPQPNGIVLDGGCGTGRMFKPILVKIKPRKIIAVDFSNSMLKKAKERMRELVRSGICSEDAFEFHKRSLTQPFPFANNFFDIEIFNLVICYLFPREWKKVLQEANRTLKTGGYIYFTTFLKGWDFRKIMQKRVFHVLLSCFSMIKAFPAIESINKINNLVKGGVIEYPEKGEIAKELKKMGFIEIETIKIFWDGGEIIRAKKC